MIRQLRRTTGAEQPRQYQAGSRLSRGLGHPLTISRHQFEQHLFAPDTSFEVLLRGHLWTESLINQLLETAAVDSRALDLDRIGFRQKVDFAQAFGLIQRRDGHALRAMHRIRSKLTHDLAAGPTEDDLRELENKLGGSVGSAFEAVIQSARGKEQTESALVRLRYWFFCYAIYLDFLSAKTRYDKENELKLLQVAAIRYAAKAYNRQQISEDEARRQVGLPDPPEPSGSWS